MDKKDSENIFEAPKILVEVEVHESEIDESEVSESEVIESKVIESEVVGSEVTESEVPRTVAPVELAESANGTDKIQLDAQIVDDKDEVSKNATETEVPIGEAEDAVLEVETETENGAKSTDSSEDTNKLPTPENDVKIEVPAENVNDEKEPIRHSRASSVSKKSAEKAAKLSSKAHSFWICSKGLTIAIITATVLITLVCMGYALFHASDTNKLPMFERCGERFCFETTTQRTSSATTEGARTSTSTTTATTAVTTESPWDVQIKTSFYVSVGTEFLAIFFKKPATFNEMKKLCDMPEELSHTSTYWPIFNFTTFNNLKLVGKAIQKHEADILNPQDDKVLIWTGAFIDVAQPNVTEWLNEDRTESLEHFENSLCPESRNYTEIVAASVNKINHLAEADVPYIELIVARPQRVHITLQYNRGGSVCLQLYDRDVGSKSNEDDSQLLPACQMRSTGHPHALPYFPRIIERNIEFNDAKRHCSPLENYTYDLSGLDQANEMFLKATSDIVGKIRGFGVWAGGFFDLKSNHPYLIKWADGRFSDSLKSPNEIWCQGKHPKDVIARMLQTNNGTSLVHLVRLKNPSDCLMPFDGDTSKHVFYPLCVTKPAQFFLRLGNDVLIPPLYEELFDKDSLSIVSLNQRYRSLSANAQNSLTILSHDDLSQVPNIPKELASSSIPAVLAGFKEKVTHDYAEMLCRHGQYDTGSAKGTLLTDTVFNLLPFNVYYSHVMAMLREKLLPLPLNSSLTTAVRFDYQKNYSQLVYYDDEKSWNGTLNWIFPWCDNVIPAVALQNSYNEFMQWYRSGGNQTTGPYYAYLAAENGSGMTCMRLIVKDLYWPGAYQWAPICQFEKPHTSSNTTGMICKVVEKDGKVLVICE